MQKRFNNYKTPAVSFEQSEVRQGLMPAGVYRGFDTITDGGGVGINIMINHEATGIQKVTAGLSFTAKNGIFISPQGTIIHEQGAVGPFAITDNGTANTRIDLLIAEHEHVSVVGGQDALYSIIQGTAGSGIPALTNPSKQIILAYITLPPMAGNFADLSFSFVEKQVFNGDSDIAKLSKNQQFTGYTSIFSDGDAAQILDIANDNKVIQCFGNGTKRVLPGGSIDSLVNLYFPDLSNEIPAIGTIVSLKCMGSVVLRAYGTPDAFGQGFITELNQAESLPSAFYYAAGDILLLQLEAYTSGYPIWRIINHTDLLTRRLLALYTQCNNTSNGLPVIPGLITGLTPTIEDNSGITLSADTGTFSMGANKWKVSSTGPVGNKDILFNVNGTITITGSPTTLYFPRTGIIPMGNTDWVSTGIIQGTNDILIIRTAYNQDRIEISKADGTAFSNGNFIQGQLVFRGA